MTIYVFFPVAVFYYFNLPNFYEEYVQTRMVCLQLFIWISMKFKVLNYVVVIKNRDSTDLHISQPIKTLELFLINNND